MPVAGQRDIPDDPSNPAEWEALDNRNRVAHIRAVRALADDARVRVVPHRGYSIRFNGRDYMHPRSFTCTYGEAKTKHVEVVQILPAPAPVDEEPARARRGRGLNRLLDDQTVGFDRAG